MTTIWQCRRIGCRWNAFQYQGGLKRCLADEIEIGVDGSCETFGEAEDGPEEAA